ncbi:MAG: site-specific DNA-methyltransferase [Acidimicrobiales bacterium]
MSNINEQDLHEISGTTPNFKTELAKQLSELMPEVVADGKVDIVKLKELLGDDAGNESERFGLFWPGKRAALRAAQEPTTATLRPDHENSKDWDSTQNVFIEGDNLEVLKILQKHYHGKIKMIYIDPPYNTGKDFVYPDNYKEGLATYLEWTHQVNESGKKISTNSESEGRYHSNWLNMMYPRLKLARNLLTEDGIIFISIDQNEHSSLLRLCSEVFGEGNVLGSVSVVNNLKGRSDDEYFATANEFLVACARNNEGATIYGFATDEGYQAEFKYSDDISNYKEVGLRKTGKNWRRIDRPNMYYPIYFNTTSSEFSLEASGDSIEIWPWDSKGGEGRWRWGKETLLQNKDTELVAREVSGNWNIYVKMRDVVDGEARTVRPKSIWIDPKYDTAGGTRAVKALFDGNNYFDNPKPIEFIKDVLAIGARKDSLILDFFAGSGTTAQAVLEQNSLDGGSRRFVLVQLPEPTPDDSAASKAGYSTISELAVERIRRVGDQLQRSLTGSQIDVGFRVFRLADTNFSKWHVTSSVNEESLGQNLLALRESAGDEATPDALLTEILLKQGYSLTEKVKTFEIDGLLVHSVGGGLLLAFLDEHTKPTLVQFRAIVDSGPGKLVILEDAFGGDDELKTNLAQLCKSKGIELWTA